MPSPFHLSCAMVRYRVRYLAAVCMLIFICVILPPPERPIPEDYSSEISFSEDHWKNPLLSCPGKVEQFRLLLVIRSQVNHKQNRDHVRRQLKERAHCSIRPIFIFGKFTGQSGEMIAVQLAEENRTTGDILQVDFEVDYRLKGLVGTQVIRSWMKNSTNCARYDEVVFGKYDVPYPDILRDNSKKYDTNWELDDCLKFAHQYRNSVQFTTAYFPPRDGATDVVWSSNSSLDTTYSYKESIVTPHDYPFLLGDSRICDSNQAFFTVIAVHSAPGNFINRKKIRQTWGSQSMLMQYKALLIFFVAVDPELSTDSQQRLIKESEEHKDIVQVDFHDSYKNMTLKQISIMKFLTKFCTKLNYSYLLKTDDDIVIDLKSIYNYFLVTIPANKIHPSRTIFCTHMNGPAIVPRYEDKWFVSRTEYPANLYPSYCSGAGYLITKDLIPVLYTTARHVKNFWVDDTYVSGILPKAAGDVSLVQIPKQHLIPLFTMRKKDVTQMRKMFIHVGQDMDAFDRFWQALQARHGIFQADIRDD